MLQLELDFEAVQLDFGFELPETPDDGDYQDAYGWDETVPAGQFAVFAVEPIEGPVLCFFKERENACAFADRWKGVCGGEATVYAEGHVMVYRVEAPDDAPPSDYSCTAEWDDEHGRVDGYDYPLTSW